MVRLDAGGKNMRKYAEAVIIHFGQFAPGNGAMKTGEIASIIELAGWESTKGKNKK